MIMLIYWKYGNYTILQIESFVADPVCSRTPVPDPVETEKQTPPLWKTAKKLNFRTDIPFWECNRLTIMILQSYTFRSLGFWTETVRMCAKSYENWTDLTHCLSPRYPSPVRKFSFFRIFYKVSLKKMMKNKYNIYKSLSCYHLHDT